MNGDRPIDNLTPEERRQLLLMHLQNPDHRDQVERYRRMREEETIRRINTHAQALFAALREMHRLTADRIAGADRLEGMEMLRERFSRLEAEIEQLEESQEGLLSRARAASGDLKATLEGIRSLHLSIARMEALLRTPYAAEGHIHTGSRIAACHVSRAGYSYGGGIGGGGAPRPTGGPINANHTASFRR